MIFGISIRYRLTREARWEIGCHRRGELLPTVESSQFDGEGKHVCSASCTEGEGESEDENKDDNKDEDEKEDLLGIYNYRETISSL